MDKTFQMFAPLLVFKDSCICEIKVCQYMWKDVELFCPRPVTLIILLFVVSILSTPPHFIIINIIIWMCLYCPRPRHVFYGSGSPLSGR